MSEQFRKGDVEIVVNGEARTLRLTLGALARLEETLGGGDFEALQKRLASPRISDILAILQALLQGGGFLVTLDQLKASDVDLGVATAAIAETFSALSARGEGAA